MYAQVNGASLFYDVSGSLLAPAGEEMREKPVIIALHGGPGVDHSGFRPWLDPLGEVALVVYLDHRGNGRSSRHDPGAYTYAQMADDVESVRVHLGLGPVIVLGHSFGGKVAQEFARRHQNSLRALILVDTAPGAQFGADVREIVQERGTTEQKAAVARMFAGHVETHDEWDQWWETCLPLYFHNPDAETLKTLARRVISSPEVASHMMRYETPVFNTRRDLPELDVPTLVMVGRHDWVTPVGQSEDIARLLPDAELVVLENSGHMPFVEENELFVKTVNDFILGVIAR